ncbi:MAG: hypothetical protein II162_04130 [Clostridia bacterium]|nr:hypothetical protein [Clostridia bacterium]
MADKKQTTPKVETKAAESDSIVVYNIEVPSEVINDSKPMPKKSGKKLKNEKVIELPIGADEAAPPKKEPPKNEPPEKEPPKKEPPKKEPAKKTTQKKQTKKVPAKKEPPKKPAEEPKEELTNTSKEVLAALEMIDDEPTQEEIVLEPIVEKSEEEPVKVKAEEKPKGREAQRRTTKKKAPAKKLATPEEQKKAEELRKKPEAAPVTEIKLPYVAKKPASKRDFNDGAKRVTENKTLSKILTWIIPTHTDSMTEVIRKGIVIICIVVLIFSMGILIRSTRLEKKAGKENAGDYFVKKYVYSYDIYKDSNSGKENK